MVAVAATFNMQLVLMNLAEMQGEDDGQTLLPVDIYLEERDGEKPIGVYALYDLKRDLQYVGYSRNMVLAVKVRTRISHRHHQLHLAITTVGCLGSTGQAFFDEPHPALRVKFGVMPGSPSMLSLVQGHLDGVGDERCAFVRAMVFANRSMATRANLEREAQNWVQEAGTTPPGNGELHELFLTPCVSFDGASSRQQVASGRLNSCELGPRGAT